MTTILRGNIIHAPSLGRLETLERGYLVLEDGKEIGYGTHEELMEECEVYREISQSQMGGGSVA